jgi:hypothetical protein
MKTDKPKPKPGRPTKYQGPQTIAKVYAIVARLRSTPADFLQLCGMEQLADQLDVSRDTLYEWSKEHPEFSDALKGWLTARNACFYRLAKTLPAAIWIFLAKNWLGMRDKQTLEFPGVEERLRFNFGDAAPLPVMIMPRPDPPKMTVHVVYTKDDPSGPVVRPEEEVDPATFKPVGQVPSKQAADLSDAELEAEIQRLEREQEVAK